MHLALDKEYSSFSESDTMTRKDPLFSPQSFPQNTPVLGRDAVIQ